MHAGTIEWNGADLSRIGKPKINIKRQPDPPAPAMATRMLVTLTVTVDLEAMDPGTIQARAQWLADTMRVDEGILRCGSGSGHTLEWMAAPGENNIEDVLTGNTGIVTLAFSAVENRPSTNSLTTAEFTPAGSATPLVLHAVRDMKHEIRTTRHSERNGARSATTTTISFTARVAHSNAADPHASRLAYLQSQAALVNALDTRQGTLVIGDTNAIVKVTEFTPQIDERRGFLDVSVQCSYITLPDAGTAECSFEIEDRAEEGTGESAISIKGEISAETRGIALAKLNALRDAQLGITGQRVISYTSSDKKIDGHDVSGSDDDDWTGALTFSLEIRKARPGGHHTLRISTQKDVRSGMRWSYSGSVRAETEAAALSVARGIASAANHPVMTKSDETVERVTDIQTPTTIHTVKVDFSYEFEGPSDGFISGEITTETTNPIAGEWRRSISGYLIAQTKSAAETRLAQLLSAETNPIESTRKWNEIYLDTTGSDASPKRVVMRLDFSISMRDTHTRVSVEYTDSTQNSIASMRQTRTISGTLWTNSEANSIAALGVLFTTVFGASGPQESTRTHSKIQAASAGTTTTIATSGGGMAQWIKLDFSASKVNRLTGVIGYDLMEASMTMSRDGCLNQSIITPIPFGRPVAQTATGYIPGRISIQATAKAINLATARTWVQGRRELVSTIGDAGITRHETDQPKETATPDYAPFDGTNAAAWSFSGTYGWTFTGTVLDGLWTTNLPG